MSMLSPTPLGPTQYSEHQSRPSMRHFPRTQPLKQSATKASSVSRGTFANGTDGRPVSVADSSDDELPAPMKFSALTKALLNEEASSIKTSSIPAEPNNEDGLGSLVDARNGTPPKISTYSKSVSSGELSRQNPFPRRIVRLSGGSPASATLKRATSSPNIVSPQARRITSRSGSPQDLITPAPRPRSVQIRVATSHSSASSAGSLGRRNNGGVVNEIEGGPQGALSTVGRSQISDSQDSALRHPSSTIGRSKYGEEYGLQGSLRVKRVGKVTGSFLSGPARRGRRRLSDEDHGSSQDDARPSMAEVDEPDEPRENKADQVFEHAQNGAADGAPDSENLPQPLMRSQYVHFNTGSPVSGGKDVGVAGSGSLAARQTSQASSSNGSSRSTREQGRPTFKIPPLPPSLPSMHDQENEPPPTFKRNKPLGAVLVDQMEKVSWQPAETLMGETPAPASPRRPLAPRDQNTPRRPAPPPPPKMTVLETATATAGAATTTQSKKKRTHISINGKTLTRLDCIGRGGSSRVYRVMAENYKIFALKKVVLEDVDAITIKGYKGEIDLLRKLDHVDRVVKLFDWEVNEEKQTLSVLMEMGESDLNRVLTYRLTAENAKFDITFARYYWKEMLECVQAVHEHGIVHSDLKPANFLLVQGRLKLIDFGIASAIQDDTVNVHREQLVGTPNYISPEAIVDTNAKSSLTTANGKIMKLGKPSDVWSLGCILYQMVYGKPPFAHITNPMQRIMAIPNPNHIIEFPAKGVGDVPVPVGLIKTLKRCLNRDQHERPTIESLLDQKHPFLYPDAERDDVVEVSQEVLGRILANVINHCKTNGVPSEAELAAWPAGFFGRIKKALREEA